MSDPRTDIPRFIQWHQTTHGYPPSIREIQSGCILSSSSVVNHWLNKLEAEGVLRRTPGIARSIVLINP